MRILVAGATSRLGRALVSELLAQGDTVRVLVRDARRAPAGVEVHEGDVTAPATLSGACDEVDVVVSSVGAPVSPTWRFPESTFEEVDVAGNLALLDEARRAGVAKVVYVSVFGDYPPGLRYVEVHEAVVRAIASSGLRYTIVRPTGFHSALALVNDLARFRIGAVIGGGAGRSNPIADEDLGRVLADAVRAEDTEIPAGGPEVLDRREMWRRAFEARGTRGIVLSIPAGIVRLQAALVRLVNRRLGDLVAFYAFVMTHDAVAPTRGSRSLAQSFGSQDASPS